MQRQTQLANDLWPLLLPRIQAMITAAGSGSGGGSSAVNLATHDLGGSLHRGTLRSDQAPQFLLIDGTRPLAGSLAVDTGVTIDGVDLSAHAADINAHHAKLHGITDAANHSATGALQYQIVGIPTAGTLGYLTPKSSPAANEIVKTDGSSAVTLVDLTVTSDLFVTGYLDFGTDVMYEDASYLQVTGSKAVRFGQNIGNANWTVYNAGGAQFGGNVDIVSGGDLTVAGSGAYAGNQVLFADSSGGNVGIMRAPDSQFALDINGPARATYWIGPHAIQLKNVLLLAHYDGRAPYATNLSGDPNGHMGQVASITGSVVYRPGKYYKAAQFAGAATNLITNPRFGNASYLTDWTQRNSPTVVAGTEGYIGSTAAWVQSAGSGSIYYRLSGLTNGVTYTASVYAKYGTPTVYLCNNSFGDTVNATWTDVGDGWQRAVVTRTVTDTYMVFVLPGTSVGVNYSNAQIEQRSFPTPYADGAMGDGHAWTGTAHASTSTRTAATLSYPTAGNLNTGAGTIMAWVWVDGNDTGTQAEGIIDAGSAWPYCAFYMSGGNTPYAIIGNASGTVGAGGPTAPGVRQWVHVAMTWTGSTLTVYTNGIAGTPASYTYAPALHTAIRVGYLGTLGNRQLNGFIDDLCILDRAASATEIRAVYESNAPVFAETSTFTFRPTPKGLIWADDEGLWARDTAGKPVFGVYGGEAATKNWGGFNLVTGDILLGNNAVGSSAIWWSRVNGTFGFYGAGSGTPQVEIATDGSLTAGAGKVKLSVDGFTAYNASNAATIYIDAEGIETGDGGARTTVASWTSGSRIKWYSVGELYAATPETYLDDSSISRTLYPLVMRAIRQGNDAALVEISAVNTSNVGAFIRVGEGFRLKDYYGTPYNANRVVHASATDIILEATNLQLRSLTTSGSAVGSYSGKIRINIAGTNVYIPYYAS